MKLSFKLIGGIFIVAGICLGIGVFYFAETSAEIAEKKVTSAPQERRPSRLRTFLKDVKKRDVVAPKERSGKRVRGAFVHDWFENLPSAADRVMAKSIQEAQDAGNCSEVLKIAGVALSSSCDEVRQAAVDALSLQGGEAIPILQKYFADKNAEIASSAYRAWDSAVDGIDFEITRIKVIEEAIPLIKGKENLESAISKFAMMDRARAIRELAKLVRDGEKSVGAVAKQVYEDMTGDSWVNWERATLKAISARSDD